jgi:uncharacterized protein (DUF1501 family)
MNRRLFLKGSALATAGIGLAPRWLRAAEQATTPKTLVLILQRGAADGLSLIPPIGDPSYADLRPSLRLEAKGDNAALKLDDPWGLHPALASLKPFWDEGTLAALHLVGSPDPTRSHFDAQDFLESGTPGRKATEDGFLARGLKQLPGSSALRAVALQPNLPRSLQGSDALALASLAEFRLPADKPGAGFEDMYRDALDRTLRGAGEAAFHALKAMQAKNPRGLEPQHGAAYPASPLGRRLKELAQLIHADLGLRIGVTDCGGWDTHVAQGAAQGQLAKRLEDLGQSLAAFLTDIQDRRDQVMVLVLTEFGRTAKENGTRGTDHGHGGAALAIGGGLKGGRVLARDFKGLKTEHLYEGRDLPVTTDFRDLLGEALTRHLGLRDLREVFPGHANDPRKWPGLFAKA